MSNIQVSPKRIKPVCNILVVVCTKHRTLTQGLKTGEANGCVKPEETDGLVKAEAGKTAREFTDFAARGSLEVQVLEAFTKDELLHSLELLQPIIVYFAVEIDTSRQEFGHLVLGDSELCSADDIVSLFKGKLPNLILRQLAAQPSYWNLVSLGIAGVDGLPVAAFQKNDAESITLLKHGKIDDPKIDCSLPLWFATPLGSRKRPRLDDSNIDCTNIGLDVRYGKQRSPVRSDHLGIGRLDQEKKSLTKAGSCSKPRLHLLAAMKPVPHISKDKLVPFGTLVGGPPASLPRKTVISSTGAVKGHHSYLTSSPSVAPSNDGNHPAAGIVPAQHALSLRFSATRKHGCIRQSLDECSEEEFLEDLMQFLVSRGHGRLIPLTGIDAFPNVVLNGKRLDLYNLYRERLPLPPVESCVKTTSKFPLILRLSKPANNKALTCNDGTARRQEIISHYCTHKLFFKSRCHVKPIVC